MGRIRKRWIIDGLEVYRKRLPGLLITELKDSSPEREMEAILAALQPEEQMVALTEEGKCFDSVTFAHRLLSQASGRLAFVIGGAAGLDPALKARASWQLSLSSMTFPHELARLLLLEQLYRAQSILQGSPYHRGPLPGR